VFQNLDELVSAASASGRVDIAVAAGHSPESIAALKQAAELGLAEGIFITGRGKPVGCAGNPNSPLPVICEVHPR